MYRLVALFVLLLSLPTGAHVAADTPSNILSITSEDNGPHLSCYDEYDAAWPGNDWNVHRCSTLPSHCRAFMETVNESSWMFFFNSFTSADRVM